MKSFTPDSYRATRFATKISPEIYTQKFYLLDGATIGGHTCHIIEFFFFLKFIKFLLFSKINYDRKRQKKFRIREKPQKSLEMISKILSGINLPNKNLLLHQTMEIFLWKSQLILQRNGV